MGTFYRCGRFKPRVTVPAMENLMGEEHVHVTANLVAGTRIAGTPNPLKLVPALNPRVVG